jgi:DNA-binding NarL/FixJ family response regulator
MITDREKEILQHLFEGLDAKQIAGLLDISVTTVRKHISNMYEKLHIQSRTQMIQIAYRNQWNKS